MDTRFLKLKTRAPSNSRRLSLTVDGVRYIIDAGCCKLKLPLGMIIIIAINILKYRHIHIEVDALGGITISRGCFERCGSNKKTPL